MKRIILRLCLIISIFISFQGSCTKATIESTTEKKKILKHNYILVHSDNNTPAQVEVSYSVFIAGNTENIVKTEKLTTPFVIGGEEVKVVYDSISVGKGNHITGYYSTMKRNYNPLGADYLSIKNMSSKNIEYCVVGNNKMTFLEEKELFGNLKNMSPEDRKKVIKYAPSPIYKGIPMLYLFKPEWALYEELFITEGKNGVIYPKKINVKHSESGGISVDSPLSLLDVLALYREEYKDGNVLYSHIQSYYQKDKSMSQKMSPNDTRLYGVILAKETLTNSGQIWFVNNHMGMSGKNHIEHYTL